MFIENLDKVGNTVLNSLKFNSWIVFIQKCFSTWKTSVQWWWDDPGHFQGPGGNLALFTRKCKQDA